MSDLDVYFKLFNNFVVWALLAVAFFTYGKLLSLLLTNKTQTWKLRCQYWFQALKILLASLPLLGLLGTISGLLTTFNFMSFNNGIDMQEMISGGIATAMFTTQLGLVFLVPGLLLHTLLKTQVKKWTLEAKCVL